MDAQRRVKKKAVIASTRNTTLVHKHAFFNHAESIKFDSAVPAVRGSLSCPLLSAFSQLKDPLVRNPADVGHLL